MVQNLDNAEFVNAVEANRIEVAKIVLGLYHFLHEEGLVLVAPPPPCIIQPVTVETRVSNRLGSRRPKKWCYKSSFQGLS